MVEIQNLGLRGGIEGQGFLVHYGHEADIGVTGASSTDASVETFEVTGGAKVLDAPMRMGLLDGGIGDGMSEITAQGGDSLGLGEAILATDLEVAAQHSFLRLA